jgi:hypothetical protein
MKYPPRKRLTSNRMARLDFYGTYVTIFLDGGHFNKSALIDLEILAA